MSMSMSTFLKSQKAFLLALDPLRQISADLNKAKDVLALIQEIVLIIIILIIIIIISAEVEQKTSCTLTAIQSTGGLQM